MYAALNIRWPVIYSGWWIPQIYQPLKPLGLTDRPATSEIYKHLASGPW